MFDDSYKSKECKVVDLVDQLSTQLLANNSAMLELEKQRLSYNFSNILREVILRAERQGKKEDLWWETTNPNGRLFFAGLTQPIGTASIWTTPNTCRFLDSMAHELITRTRLLFDFKNTLESMLEEETIRSEAVVVSKRSIADKRIAARDRKRKSREADAANADTEEGKAKREARNQKKRNRYARMVNPAKNQEESMLGKRETHNDAIDIHETDSEEQQSN